jgi:L-aminopeptidase/D-esterase-like protein
MSAGPSAASAAGSIVDVPGIEVGHAQNAAALTGCTVVLCRRGAVAGVDVRGSAPGTRETDLLNPINLVQRVHAVMLAGGSAFGLDAASGAMRYLDERKIGFRAGTVKVPIVPAAILFDLGLGDRKVRPNADMGYAACAAASRSRFPEGNVGAGTGASVGKLLGLALSMKSGLGTASLKVGGIVVGALVAVNSFGDVIDPANGAIVAGLRSGRIGPLRVGGREYFADTLAMMKTALGRGVLSLVARTNTLIGVVATNAALTKTEATKVAQMAQDGLARAIRPAHTMLDGDTLFALSTGRKKADVSLIGAFAAEVVTRAILRAVKSAASAGGLPGLYQV